MPKPADSVFRMVQDGAPENGYLAVESGQVSATRVPSRAAAQPLTVCKRTFRGLGSKPEEELVTEGSAPAPEPAVEPPAGAQPPAAGQPPAAEQPRGRRVRVPARMVQELSGQLAALRQALQARAEPAPVAAAPAPQPSPAARPVVKNSVRLFFRGAFGEVSVPALRIFEGSGCLVVHQATDGDYTYIPPVSDDAPLMVSWQDGSVRTDEAPALYVGLQYNPDPATRALIFLLPGQEGGR